MLEAAPSWHGARGNVARADGRARRLRRQSPPTGGERGDYDVLDKVLTSRRRRRRDGRGALAGDGDLVSRLQRETGAARRPPCPPCTGTRDRPARAGGAATEEPRPTPADASADDARALAPRRPDIRPRSRPRPPERGGPPRRTCPRRDHARVSRPVGGRGDRRRRPARRDRHSSSTPTRTSDPEGAAAIERGAHAYIWAWGAEYPDPGGGFLEPFFIGRFLPRRAAREVAGPSGVAPRPGRAPPARTAIRAHLDRRTSGRGTARVRRPCLWRRPWVTGMWANALTRSTFAAAVVRRPASAGAADGAPELE